MTELMAPSGVQVWCLDYDMPTAQQDRPGGLRVWNGRGVWPQPGKPYIVVPD